MPRKRSQETPLLLTVEKSIRVLKALADHGPELGVTEIARLLGESPSVISRLLATFDHFSFVRQNPKTQKYRLGVGLFELSNAALGGLELVDIARPTLEHLNQATGETIFLMVLDGLEGIYIQRIDSPQRVAIQSRVGRREPLHASSVGKALIAFLPEEELERIIERQGLVRYTPRTITNPNMLKLHLAEVRKQGFAIDDEEGETGIRCIGAPIFGQDGRPQAAISVSGPAYRTSIDRLLEWSPLVVKAALDISRQLGYHAEKPGEPAAGAAARRATS